MNKVQLWLYSSLHQHSPKTEFYTHTHTFFDDGTHEGRSAWGYVNPIVALITTATFCMPPGCHELYITSLPNNSRSINIVALLSMWILLCKMHKKSWHRRKSMHFRDQHSWIGILAPPLSNYRYWTRYNLPQLRELNKMYSKSLTQNK